MKNYILLLNLLLVQICAVKAQDFKSQYSLAKQNFDNGRYEQALNDFKSLMVYETGNNYTEYAAFYYGLSAFRQNFKTLAKNTFLSIEQTYPDWNQIDEVKYWLAFIYFDQGEYFRAMEKLSSIKRSIGQQELKKNFLSRIKDPEILRMLLEDFHDREVAEGLIKLLISINKEETLMEAKRLMGTFDFQENQFIISKKTSTPDPIRVALLFPFLAQSLEPTPVVKRNQYALDLYQGIDLAADSLHKAGIPIELALYDTERNPEKVKDILSKPEIKSSDILVGPLFNDEIKVVKDFSIQSKIPMIHPVSNSPEYLEGNPYSILFQPTWATIGLKSADFVASVKLNKPWIVIYENTIRDSVMAHAFRERAKSLDIPLLIFKEVSKENSEVIRSILTTAVKFDKWKNPIEFKLKKDSIGGIFVASDSELIFTKVIAAVDARNDHTLIVGQETWLDKTGMDLVKFEALGITLAAPNYYSPFSLNFKNFEKRFIDRHHTLPGLYARIGFEFMMCIGQQSNLKNVTELNYRMRSTGFLFNGYESSGKPDNQLVPFVRFKEGELIRVDQ